MTGNGLKAIAAGSALATIAAFTVPAVAAPPTGETLDPPAVLMFVSGGCGIGSHRDFRGFCRVNYRRFGYGYRPGSYYRNRSWERHWGF